LKRKIITQFQTTVNKN